MSVCVCTVVLDMMAFSLISVSRSGDAGVTGGERDMVQKYGEGDGSEVKAKTAMMIRFLKQT